MLQITNENYSCEVVSINPSQIKKAQNSDNLLSVSVMGYNVLVNKNTDLTKPLLFFPAECVVNEKYLSKNNLYSSSELNVDKEAKGYIGKQGRIKAVKLRGNNSSALFMPISSLQGLTDYSELKVGDKFNILNGFELTKKYEKKFEIKGMKNTPKSPKRIEEKTFPKHFDTVQFLRNLDEYNLEDDLIITQKLHGTSLRVGNVEVKMRRNLMDKILGRTRTKYDLVFGTRNVIKNDLNTENNFYKTDIYSLASRTFEGILPKDVVVYAEIVGWAGENTPVQKGYTYDLPQGAYRVYVYRITSVNKDGFQIDWSWDAITQFCDDNGLNTVPLLEKVKYKNFNWGKYEDKNFFHGLGLKQCVSLPKEICDEGICIRKEGIRPLITKYKFPKFLEHETIILDEGEEVLG